MIAETLQQDENTKECLVNMVRSILFRRTHASRLLAVPVLSLPDIGEETVEATFCEVEEVMYNRIFAVFIENIRGERNIHDSPDMY